MTGASCKGSVQATNAETERWMGPRGLVQPSLHAFVTPVPDLRTNPIGWCAAAVRLQDYGLPKVISAALANLADHPNVKVRCLAARAQDDGDHLLKAKLALLGRAVDQRLRVTVVAEGLHFLIERPIWRGDFEEIVHPLTLADTGHFLPVRQLLLASSHAARCDGVELLISSTGLDRCFDLKRNNRLLKIAEKLVAEAAKEFPDDPRYKREEFKERVLDLEPTAEPEEVRWAFDEGTPKSWHEGGRRKR